MCLLPFCVAFNFVAFIWVSWVISRNLLGLRCGYCWFLWFVCSLSTSNTLCLHHTTDHSPTLSATPFCHNTVIFFSGLALASSARYSSSGVSNLRGRKLGSGAGNHISSVSFASSTCEGRDQANWGFALTSWLGNHPQASIKIEQL